ncbi:putative ABC transporter ATP-binding protein [Anaerotignum neopropionicum]|uniref:Putative ABC transporter ATP-binding protein n=1 Tax=Anaerotignum neopropionicum TaxID=36847 RepID=A0A136WFB5_9FIRM|nr:ABC transporter ATP-binding protein [Anaerotignum neopropionicum]KXL53201.1 putative ABC transporter ATP-binding protein [Anaerotignum neopropionicum]
MKIILKYMKPYRILAILAPLFMMIEASSELIMPKLMTLLINQGVATSNSSYILKMGAAMISIAILGIIGGIGCLICAAIVSQRAGADLRKDLFIKIQNFSFHNIDTFQTPSLITRLTNDITQIQMVILMSLRMLIRAPLLCFGSLIMAFTINAKLAMIFIIAIAILGLAMFFIMRKAMPKFQMVQNKLDGVNTVMRECLAGMRVVKAFVRHDYEMDKFNTANEDYKETNLKAFRIVIIMLPAMMLILNVSVIAILWFGGIQVYSGTLRIEEIMAFITYLMQMVMSLMMMAMVFMYISRAQISLNRVNEVLKEEIDIVDPVKPVLPKKNEGKVSFDNVFFRYEGGSGEPVLEGISFVANPGETIGILGETGSGKSTLVNLMPRLYDVSQGAIYIDGVDVRHYTIHELRKKVAVILQETILFTGTIRENIKWGNKDATEDQVIAAAKAAQAHDFIMELPNGYDTELGQKGVNVSGGQKQRISIARAIIQNPNIIIFDDSTSAVDSLTEKRIRQSMMESHRHCTKFMIAQKISSIKEADKILVLKDGKIVAEGNHNKLMETSVDYQEIYYSQMKKGGVLDE